MGQTTFAGTMLIVGSAAFAGAVFGGKFGPFNLEVSPQQLAFLCAGLGGSIALLGCGSVLERTAAQARSHAAFLRLKRTLLRSQDETEDEGSQVRPVRVDTKTASRPTEFAKPLAGRTGSPTCR